MMLVALARAATLDVWAGDDLWAALDALPPGSEVVVHAGTWTTQQPSGSWYRELVFNGTEAEPIVVRVAEGEAVRVEGDPAGSQNTWNVTGSWYTVQGFEFVYGSHGLRVGGSSHGTFRDNVVHDTLDVGISMNRDGSAYDSMLFAGNEVYDTHGTGECFYLGCNDGACVVSNSIIEFNYCHDTATTEQGDGIELKSGSYGNVIRHNVIVNTNYPGITMYGTYGGAPNRVEGNLVWGTVDNGIQIVGDVEVVNNVVIDAGAYGLCSKASQSATPDDLLVAHNTVLRAGAGCFRANDWDGVADAVVANNALLCDGGTAVRLGGGTGAARFAGNVVVGSSAVTTGVTDGGSAEALVVHPSGPDLFPLEGSALVDGGDGAAAGADDFDCRGRFDAPDVGAYEWFAGGAPAWALQGGFKPCTGKGGGSEDSADTGAVDTGPTDTAPVDTGPTDTDLEDPVPPVVDDPAGEPLDGPKTPAGCGCAGAPGAPTGLGLLLIVVGWSRTTSRRGRR